MRTYLQVFLLSVFVLVPIVGVLFAPTVQSGSTAHDSDTASHAPSSAAGTARADEGVLPDSVVDRPLAEVRLELLDLAFEIASALPVAPHIKTRSRLQESAAGAALELEQPRRALSYSRGIHDWRRGCVYAGLALHLAREDEHGEAAVLLDLAERIADGADVQQDWQRERIRAIAARARSEPARRGLSRSNPAGSGDAGSDGADAAGFEGLLRDIDAILATDALDAVRGALDRGLELFDHHYADAERRGELERRIERSMSKLPPGVRIDVLQELAGRALAHGEPTHALSRVEEAEALVDAARWSPEDHVARLAALAALRGRCGESESARVRLASAQALFEAQRERIVDIYRSGALRALAEASHSLGGTAEALVLYGRAIDAALVNPNSRPRAEDLAGVCLSMARNGVEPDDRIREQLSRARGSLGDPW